MDLGGISKVSVGGPKQWGSIWEAKFEFWGRKKSSRLLRPSRTAVQNFSSVGGVDQISIFLKILINGEKPYFNGGRGWSYRVNDGSTNQHKRSTIDTYIFLFSNFRLTPFLKFMSTAPPQITPRNHRKGSSTNENLFSTNQHKRSTNDCHDFGPPS